MKIPHVHAELIHAWADGAEIEERLSNFTGEFITSFSWYTNEIPSWDPAKIYRIKPEPKPDVVEYWAMDIERHFLEGPLDLNNTCNLKLTFDGETGKLKSAEVLK